MQGNLQFTSSESNTVHVRVSTEADTYKQALFYCSHLHQHLLCQVQTNCHSEKGWSTKKPQSWESPSLWANLTEWILLGHRRKIADYRHGLLSWFSLCSTMGVAVCEVQLQTAKERNCLLLDEKDKELHGNKVWSLSSLASWQSARKSNSRTCPTTNSGETQQRMTSP